MSEPQSVTRLRCGSIAYSKNAVPSPSTKRGRSEVTDDDDDGKHSKKRKTQGSIAKYVDRFVFHPDAVYGHKCLGILFTTSSIRGRATTVFSVQDASLKRIALRMAWQDGVTRMPAQDSVMERLKNQGSQLHPNVIVPLMTEKVEKGGEMCTTLGGIRGFLDGQIEELGVENRVLTISASELKRPVKYFWGVHDFVRGLRGALLEGHEYLTKIGILHRDISENNIVLGLRPGDERGYLIDLDLAILQNAEEPKPLFSRHYTRESSPLLFAPDTITCEKPVRVPPTGTFPYISYNLLWGGRHTQFDDVESFLYVLFLFFFSYAGPLSPLELSKADEAGFVQSIGSGRLSHMRNWPRKYANWADGEAKQIGANKFTEVRVATSCGMRIIQDAEFVDCLEKNWPKELHHPIRVLIASCFWIFSQSTFRAPTTGSRTEVSHATFVSILDKWLDAYSHLEDKFSNCPFKQSAMCETES